MRSRVFYLRWSNRRWPILSMGYVLLVLILTWWAVGQEIKLWWQPVGQSISRVVWEEAFALTEWSEESLADIFADSIPLWQAPNQASSDNPVGSENIPEPGFLRQLMGIEFGQPATYLQEGLHLLALSQPAPEIAQQGDGAVHVTTEEDGTSNSETTADPGGAADPKNAQTEQLPKRNNESTEQDPQVFIYHTHTGETYARTDGLVKLQGKLGGVYLVGEAMKNLLAQRYQLPSLHSDQIHDTSWLKSNPYSESYRTVKTVVNDNPSLQIVLDLHRDAKVPRENSIVQINGQTAARIMLVVGTNARNNHPNWTKNFLFAQKVGKAMEQKYPGLLRKVTTQDGRYNQHLHPHAILVEIGSTENSTEEAVRAGELFAEILADLLKE